LRRADVSFHAQTGAPEVSLIFDSDGSALFEKITERNVGKRIAIFLDNTPITAPVVQDKITQGEAVITGSFTLAEAKQLVTRLNAGALPVPISLESRTTVGPTLGKDSLGKSVVAGVVGLLAVVMYVIALYRLPGVIAAFALILYALLNLVAYKILGVTMTLAGAAGFILSIGMAVDANILIFERLKEELRNGRPLRQAIPEGFREAWSSIRDSNVSSLITCVLLYALGSSIVRGFALTLGLGILLSMFSAITVTRTLLQAAVAARSQSSPRLFASGLTPTSPPPQP
jgi:protein-export membrane protein SecD